MDYLGRMFQTKETSKEWMSECGEKQDFQNSWSIYIRECEGPDHEESWMPYYGICILSCRGKMKPIRGFKQERDVIIFALWNDNFSGRQ